MTAGRDGGTGRSLRSLVQAILVGSALVLVASVVAGAWSYLSMVQARQRLADHVDPALTSAMRLRAATGDQQSGARGYSFTGDEDFIEPWIRGREEADEALRDLRRLLEDHPEILDELDEVEAALRVWQTDWAERSIDNARRGERTSRADYADGRVRFTELREQLDEVVGQLRELRRDARAALDDASSRLVVTLGLVLATLAFLIVAVAVGLRRLVLRPIERVVDDAGRIAMGDLDHVPAHIGAEELAELGRSLDHVRAALVAQLREVEAREAELTRSNAELEQFAYVASHDLQEPLRKVASFCQMLQRRYHGQLDERADTYIEYAVDGARRMQELINDLLTFSRVGRTTNRFELVELDAVLDTALRNLSAVIDESGATIERQPLPAVAGDRALLVALFQNLVGNGIKFRGEEPPVVRVSVADDGEGNWEVCVSDNGIGIPEEYRDRVFVIFQRLHGRDEYPGTGIGLSLCRKIVEFHGGRIDVADHHDGPGTSIRFTLPQDLSSQPPRDHQEVPAP
ncbi:MAG TPA: ATP-binding protein [Microthrixaceae bacterium]|nr:ATP-binding protein [Microthrixaceae bacterium]